MSEQILTEEAWKERCRLLVLENDELMAENEQLKIELAELQDTKTALEELKCQTL